MTPQGPEGAGDATRLDDAFAILGNETRMAILQALWDQRDSFASTEANTLSFTELRERVGVADPGQFNYHINRLVGEFIKRTEHGYALRANAVQVLRAAIVRRERVDITLPTTEAAHPCPFCSATVEVTYGDEKLVVCCTEHPRAHGSDILAGGTLMNSPVFQPTGIADRTGQDLWEALFDHVVSAAFGLLRGVCPVCTAVPATIVEHCHTHVDDGRCERCGSTQGVTATVRCQTCSFAWRGPAWVTVMPHPDVIGFFHNRGVVADGGFTLEMYSTFLTSRQTLRSHDPLVVDVFVEQAGDALTATFDEELAVQRVRMDA